MQRFIPYPTTTIKFELVPRLQRQRNRQLPMSVASPDEPIAFLLDLSLAKNSLQVTAWLKRTHFDLLVGKTIAISSPFHFGEMFSIANDLRIEIETLIVLPGPSQSSERADAFAASLGAVIDAGKGTGQLSWFAGRVAFMVPTKTPLEVWLGELKGHELIPAKRLDHWPREGLRTLVASTSKLRALPFTEIGRLANHERWGSLLAVSEIDHCGPNYAFLKDLAPQLRNPISVLD